MQPLPGTTPTMFSVSRMKIDIHFSLIAAAVTYIMWKSVGEDKIKKMEGKKLDDDDHKKRKGYWRVDCQSASKGIGYLFFYFQTLRFASSCSGLFLGLLCLVGGIIIIIIFFVMKDSEEFRGEMFWIYYGAEIVILSFAILASVGAFVQVTICQNISKEESTFLYLDPEAVPLIQ